jgi:hypothetical protein
MMKSLVQKVKNFANRFQFLQGVAIGLTASSFLAYGVVTINTFTAGTAIKSADVNENFEALKSAIDTLQTDMQLGFTGVGLTRTFTATCDESVDGTYNPAPILLDHNDGNYDIGTGEFTAPITALYELYIDAPSTASIGSPFAKFKMEVNEVPEIIYPNSVIKIVKLMQNDVLKFTFSCHGMSLGGAGQELIFNQLNFILSLKKH